MEEREKGGGVKLREISSPRTVTIFRTRVGDLVTSGGMIGQCKRLECWTLVSTRCWNSGQCWNAGRWQTGQAMDVILESSLTNSGFFRSCSVHFGSSATEQQMF